MFLKILSLLRSAHEDTKTFRNAVWEIFPERASPALTLRYRTHDPSALRFTVWECQSVFLFSHLFSSKTRPLAESATIRLVWVQVSNSMVALGWKSPPKHGLWLIPFSTRSVHKINSNYICKFLKDSNWKCNGSPSLPALFLCIYDWMSTSVLWYSINTYGSVMPTQMLLLIGCLMTQASWGPLHCGICSDTWNWDCDLGSQWM